MIRFFDEAKIVVRSGAGGNGSRSFRREAFVPRGGPDGGDGGDGGSVVLAARANLTTLVDFQYRRRFQAADGGHGRGKKRHGAKGADLVIPVPCGTSVSVLDGGSFRPIADLVADGQTFHAARGGKGGLGNTHFKTSTNRAPRRTVPGGPAEERTLFLELRLIADVGIVGFPNAGKSTFLAAVSRAAPRIADYPFTTLSPNLGIARLDEERRLILADIPGLIEGASEGKGLGHKFLRHIERTRVILHLVDLTAPDPVAAHLVIRREMERHHPDLAAKPEVLAGTKADLPGTARAAAALRRAFPRAHIISAPAGRGVAEVIEDLWAVSRPSPTP